MTENLGALTLLITRPQAQAESLSQLAGESGYKSIVFPVIEIKPLVDKSTINSKINRLNEYDLVIFISINAVEFTWANLAAAKKSWPKQLKVAAVGKSTADLLSNKGVSVKLYPEREFSSEGLLNHADLADMQNQKILIVRGVGGRDYLARTLSERGAAVEYLEVYRRCKPDEYDLDVFDSWQTENSIIICTSKEGIRNLIEMTAAKLNLKKAQLLVVSQRLVDYALEQGFTPPIILANNAKNEAILQTLNHYLNTGKNPDV